MTKRLFTLIGCLALLLSIVGISHSVTMQNWTGLIDSEVYACYGDGAMVFDYTVHEGTMLTWTGCIITTQDVDRKRIEITAGLRTLSFWFSGEFYLSELVDLAAGDQLTVKIKSYDGTKPMLVDGALFGYIQYLGGGK